jgi:acyl-CoA thioesterase
MTEAVSPELFAALAADPLAELLGIHIESIAPGFARARMTVGAGVMNAAGAGHGGATMALIDVIHAAVSNSHGTLAVAQEVHTEFLAAGRLGDELVCEGVELSRTRRTAVYRIEVRAEPREGQDEPTLIATALARVFRIGDPWLPAEGGAGASG